MKDDKFSDALVKLQHKIKRVGVTYLKIGDKYYKVKELG